MKTTTITTYNLLLISCLLLFSACKNYEPNSVSDQINSSEIYSTFTPNNEKKLNSDSTKNIAKLNPLYDQYKGREQQIDSTKQYVYLTFDDGPFKGSEKINKIIKEEQVKATVFIVGMNAYTDRLQQYLDDYKSNDLIEVSNHTFSHANRNKFKQYYNNPDMVLDDVIKNDSIYNFKNRFVRLPGRNVWRLGDHKKNDYDNGSKLSSDLLAENHYFVFGWDYEWNKISKKTPLEKPEVIYNGIINRLNNKQTFKDKHLVILMHDDMFDNDEDAEKLRSLIKMIKSNKNIIFEVASNYPISLS